MIHNVKLELLIKHRNKGIILHFIIKQKLNQSNMIRHILGKL